MDNSIMNFLGGRSGDGNGQVPSQTTTSVNQRHPFRPLTSASTCWSYAGDNASSTSRAVGSLASFPVPSPIVPTRPNGRQRRNPWTLEEDRALKEIMHLKIDSHTNWSEIAIKLGGRRTGKQCRERYQNHLRPNIKKGEWSVEEEQLIQTMFEAFGKKWSSMAKVLENRTDNDIKNKWYSMKRSKETKMKRGRNEMASKTVDSTAVGTTPACTGSDSLLGKGVGVAYSKSRPGENESHSNNEENGTLIGTPKQPSQQNQNLAIYSVGTVADTAAV